MLHVFQNWLHFSRRGKGGHKKSNSSFTFGWLKKRFLVEVDKKCSGFHVTCIIECNFGGGGVGGLRGAKYVVADCIFIFILKKCVSSYQLL